MAAAEKAIDHAYTDEVVCPFCGYEHGDSFELDNSGTMECNGCEKEFEYERHAEATYCTSKPAPPRKPPPVPPVPPEDRSFEAGVPKPELRVGTINLYDASIGLWEERVEDEAHRRIFYGMLAHLHARGFRFERDTAHTSTPSNEDWIGKRGALEVCARVSGRVVQIDFFQSVTTEPKRGRYDGTKPAKMPRRIQLECITELTLLVRRSLAHGYVFNDKMPESDAPLLLRVRDKALGVRTTDPLTFSNEHHWKHDKRDASGFMAFEYYKAWRYTDHDGVRLETGATRYFYDYGRLMRGTVYPASNGQWFVAFRGEVTVKQVTEFFLCDPEKTDRRFVRGQADRLQRELEKAVQKKAYGRVTALGRVLERMVERQRKLAEAARHA